MKKGDFLQILHLQRLASLELSRPIVNGFKLLHLAYIVCKLKNYILLVQSSENIRDGKCSV